MLVTIIDFFRPFLQSVQDAPFFVRFCITMGLGMLPAIENRMALFISVALGLLTPLPAFFAGSLGTILVICFLVPGFDRIMRSLRGHHPRLDEYLDRLLHTTRKEHSHRFNRFGALILILLTALPLPAAGAYTSVLVSYVFGVPPRSAVLVLTCGIICAGLVGLVILHTAKSAWNFF